MSYKYHGVNYDDISDLLDAFSKDQLELQKKLSKSKVTKINVIDKNDYDISLEFLRDSSNTLRLWMYKQSSFYKTIGSWCPHLIDSRGHNECTDCGLVYENNEDYEDDYEEEN